MGGFATDLRYALRSLRRNPGFTAVVLLTLALGIGANTAIFSVVNGVLLRPLGFGAPDRLVAVWEWKQGHRNRVNVVSPANFLDWRDRQQVFTDMALSTWGALVITGDSPERVPGRAVTPNYFDVLGVRPALGRGFIPSDAQPGAQQVIVLSDGLWRRRFGADPKVVGSEVPITGGQAMVAGVMPRSFQPLGDEEYWEPWHLGPDYRQRQGRYAAGVARLKPGVTLEAAQSQMTAIGKALELEAPDFNTGWNVRLVPMTEQVVGDARRSILVLLGAVGLVLLIACANIGNLLLGRAAARQRESAVRVALGVSAGRLTRQWITESMVLGLGGGALGLLVASWSLSALTRVGAPIPRLSDVTLDGRVLLFTLAVSLVTSVLFGLAPAIALRHADLQPALKGETPGLGRGGTSRLRVALVVGQVALALTLLVGAGLMIRTLVRLRGIDPGFEAVGVIVAQVGLPDAKYADSTAVVAFFTQLGERVRALPGVRDAGMVSWLPFGGSGAATRVTVDGRPAPPPGQEAGTDVRQVDGSYFKTMGIPLRRGRVFEPTDRAGAPTVVVVSESFARTLFPSEDPIGKRISLSWDDPAKGLEIVGVVGDIHHDALDADLRPMVYYDNRQNSFNIMHLVIRTDRTPESIAAALRAEVAALDPEQPVQRIEPMTALVSGSLAQRRFLMAVLGGFAGIALALSAIGIYGVLAFVVRQREREIGIRMALGADAPSVLRMVVGRGLAWTAVGIGLGLAAAWATTRLLGSMLYGISPTDGATFALVVAGLAAVAAIACWVPARRATRVDPMVALRSE